MATQVTRRGAQPTSLLHAVIALRTLIIFLQAALTRIRQG